ncbi:hypothetical protein HK097_006990 [Rhizophlyctis rosea]|uniref:Uncharacterized protein n=1 Tax=Rhizophlyctis rosea TaxID=64517 RepID=A0AAD5SCQ3_9FUNG|nr:hypothetical protein HK097_006990 [Rhizophlyctis rosea]
MRFSVAALITLAATSAMAAPQKSLGCIRTGCSGTICASKSVFTTCEYKPEYECYKLKGVTCGKVNGVCAWSGLDDLQECLDNARARTAV